VIGVETGDGHQYLSDFVVSNADPITTGREMIGMDKLPKSFFAGLKSDRVAPSTINAYMGVAKSPEELGLTNHEIFINADTDFDSHYEKMSGVTSTDAIALTNYNHVYPDISPPGTSMVVLTSLAYGEPWYDVPPERYVETKTKLADRMIDLAELISPDLRKHTEVIEVSTPLTNMRYAGTMGGSIYGFDNTPWGHSMLRMSPKGPLDGLFFVGAWTQPGGGFEPSIMSGMMTGIRVASKLKKRGKVA
jgi:prolycopene isomerase